MPCAMKDARVSPVLKKQHLDSEVLNNYRPVSNLAFVSKLTEKIVAKRLTNYLKENNLHEPLQSAYRQYCSTETALLKVQDHILQSVDQRKGVVLLLLDLSAAFDTIDHTTLLKTLEMEVGIKGECLDWVASYLADRSQSVLISGEKSDTCTLSSGVPQGSVLGPLFFTIYTIPLAKILRKHGISFHLYADDTQMYVEFHLLKASENEAIKKLELCVALVRHWMRNNMLKFNDEKTEVIIILPKGIDPKKFTTTVTVGNSSAAPTSSARNLGVIFDKTFSLTDHVSSVCKAAYWQLYSIGRIRQYLDLQSAKQIIHARHSRPSYVSSRCVQWAVVWTTRQPPAETPAGAECSS